MSRLQTSALIFSPPLSLLTAALSSLQLPLSLYLLTHLSRGEVVTQHEGVVSTFVFSAVSLSFRLSLHETCFPKLIISLFGGVSDQ